ncbi:histidine biosynthesis trifunctional-protein [Phaffia rhodozyma]|uniref:Histidine biosynthesis trifunctional protein n=1 Tax=Phaffia rhodozyma TaxID=264483 RepID=A0A0F7SME1_PHARH|nr:histidine biosynthesis trifunctional-protein [Phaffia rhodozyma]
MSPQHFLPLLTPSSDDSSILEPLSLLGPILTPIAELGQLPANASAYVLATAKDTVDQLIEVLNNGAHKVVVSAEQAIELAKSVSKERLVSVVAFTDVEALTEDVKKSVGGFLVTGVAHANDILDTLAPFKNTHTLFLHLTSAPVPSEIRLLVQKSITPVLPTTVLSVSTNSVQSKISIASAFLAPLTSDRPDGLFPTFVTSYAHSRKPLGLVYSSIESITESILTGRGVYQSRKHGLWRKGESSGATQQVVSIRADCDSDAVEFEVVQTGTGFCHLGTSTCFGEGSFGGIAALEDTLIGRKQDAPAGSYTARLFSDSKLLRAKIMEEAEELCEATEKSDVAFEAADLVYFAMTKCVQSGVSWRDVEAALEKKALKVKRRQGDAKPKWTGEKTDETPREPQEKPVLPAAAPPPRTTVDDPDAPIKMRTVPALSSLSAEESAALLVRPVLDSQAMMAKVQPIIDSVRNGGDAALLDLTRKFDRLSADAPASNVILPPFAEELMQIPEDLKQAIDVAYENVRKFHQAQAEDEPLVVETMPGVVCTRFARAITRVGVYVPGGTAVLPSSAIMLGVPAQVAGCSTIVLATPPRPDGTISPEVMYAAKLVGATCVVKAGGAQAVAAMAYGTESVPKVDKIAGPGNQWVTAAKMVVQNDVKALVSIDMPAGPSEVLVVADSQANPIFVASDLLSQAEHGVDSQVVLVGISLSKTELAAIEHEVDIQARALPRCEIARKAIAQSIIVNVDTREEAMAFSNEYAPEHLILQVANPADLVADVVNAGSVFVGAWSPESCGDLGAGPNHTLPTYGFARQYSGVNTLTFQKHITSQQLSEDGIRLLGPSVVRMAEAEGLEGHANAVRVRLAHLKNQS